MVPMDLVSRWKMVIKTKEVQKKDEDAEQMELSFWPSNSPVAQGNCRNDETHCMIRANHTIMEKGI